MFFLLSLLLLLLMVLLFLLLSPQFTKQKLLQYKQQDLKAKIYFLKQYCGNVSEQWVM